MERLTPKTLDSILTFARKSGLVVFIDADGELKAYPRTSRAFVKVRGMLAGNHAEMKMHIIRTIEGETV